MAAEKLLTVKDVSLILGISEKEVMDLVENKQLAAYKVGGVYIRFKEEQITQLRKSFKPGAHKKIAFGDKTLPLRGVGRSILLDNSKRFSVVGKVPYAFPHHKNKTMSSHTYAFKDRINDFFYFNDFYILSVLIILLILVIIFQGY